MCGICGFVGRVESQGIALEAMMQALYRQDDDDQGEYYWESGAMACSQEEIVEVKGCHQPRVSEDGRLVLVCDGVLTNTESLKESLERVGHHFRCGSENEVILHAYEEFGEEIVNYLEGSYALVIWNQKEERLFAARDVKGGRPLYYALVGGRLAFATSLSSILAFVQFLGKTAMSVAPSEIRELSAQTGKTSWKGVYQLEAGQDFCYEKNLLRVQCYRPAEIEQQGEDLSELSGEAPMPEPEHPGLICNLLRWWKRWMNKQIGA